MRDLAKTRRRRKGIREACKTAAWVLLPICMTLITLAVVMEVSR